MKIASVCSIALVILLNPISDARAQTRKTTRLNENAVAFATQLIKEGYFAPDSKGAWSKHRPTADKEDAFIRLNGLGEYAKWHLGIDERYPENTKRRYKFPYGDFKNVHRCGLLAARSGAAEYAHYDIESAAARLIEMISSKKQEAAAPLPNP